METNQTSEENIQVAAESSTTEATEVTVTDGNTTSETSYLDGKYKSVSDLETGYRELQSSYSKKLGNFDGSPEEYTFADGVEKDSTLELLTEWGKENQLSQKGLDTFTEKYAELNTKSKEAQELETAQFREAETKKLGDNADYRIKNATDWVKANLGQEGIDVLNNLGGAQGIEVVEKIMQLTKGVAPSSAPTAPTYDKDKVKAMRFAKDEFGNRRMSSDPTYRKKVEDLEAQLLS